jgi:transcription elongation factor Elf1
MSEIKKRPKKTKLIIHKEVVESVRCTYKCPHCHTEVRDYTLSKSVLMVLCGYCGQPVDFRPLKEPGGEG